MKFGSFLFSSSSSRSSMSALLLLCSLVTLGLLVPVSNAQLNNYPEMPPPEMPEELYPGWQVLQDGCRNLFGKTIDVESFPMQCSWNIGLFAAINSNSENNVHSAANWAECLAASTNSETCGSTITTNGIQCSYCSFSSANPAVPEEIITRFGEGTCLPSTVVSSVCEHMYGAALWQMNREEYWESIPRPVQQSECLRHSEDATACTAATDSNQQPCSICELTSNLDYNLFGEPETPSKQVCFQKNLLDDHQWCTHLNSRWTQPGDPTNSASPLLGTALGTSFAIALAAFYWAF